MGKKWATRGIESRWQALEVASVRSCAQDSRKSVKCRLHSHKSPLACYQLYEPNEIERANDNNNNNNNGEDAARTTRQVDQLAGNTLPGVRLETNNLRSYGRACQSAGSSGQRKVESALAPASWRHLADQPTSLPAMTIIIIINVSSLFVCRSGGVKCSHLARLWRVQH